MPGSDASITSVVTVVHSVSLAWDVCVNTSASMSAGSATSLSTCCEYTGEGSTTVACCVSCGDV